MSGWCEPSGCYENAADTVCAGMGPFRRKFPLSGRAAPPAPAPPPLPFGPARAARNPWWRRVALRPLLPRVCWHNQSPPGGALGAARERGHDWLRASEGRAQSGREGGAGGTGSFAQRAAGGRPGLRGRGPGNALPARVSDGVGGGATLGTS